MVDTSVLQPYLTNTSLTPTNQAVMNTVAGTTNTFVPAPQPTLPTAGDLGKFYQQAFQALQPYYAAKLQEAKGDLEEAKRRITYDYQTGTRYNQQDTALKQERETQDFVSAMQTLGLTFDKEYKEKVEDLNKRGIATVQDPSGRASLATASPITYDAQGKPVQSTTQGQAGSEVSLLADDQRLRKEAETRIHTRALQDVGITSTRKTEELGETQGRGSYDAMRQFQQTGEQLGEQQQSQAYSIAGQMSSAEAAQKAAQASEESIKASQAYVKSLG